MRMARQAAPDGVSHDEEIVSRPAERRTQRGRCRPVERIVHGLTEGAIAWPGVQRAIRLGHVVETSEGLPGQTRRCRSTDRSHVLPRRRRRPGPSRRMCRSSGDQASVASSPSSRPSPVSDAGASTIASGPGESNSIAAAVGQKCESDTNVPRASCRTSRGNIRHVVGSAADPPVRWMAHK